MPRSRRKRGSGSGSGTGVGASSGPACGAVQTTDPIEDAFVAFFQQYREGNDNVMFYKAELAAIELKQSSTPTLRVDYLHIMDHSPLLAYSLLSETERTKGLMASAFKRYIPEESFLHSKELSIYCYNFPVFDRKELLLDFLTSSPPVVAFKLHDGDETPVCSPPGSKLFQGFVDYLLTHHNKGLTWNGDFQAVDMIVLTINGRYEFQILKKPTVGVDHDSMSNDFKRLADILLHHYTLNTSGKHKNPPFFTRLCTILRKIPQDVPSNIKSMERFTMFLCNHMAFLPSMSRSNLIYNLMRVYKVLGPKDQAKFERVVNQRKYSIDWRLRTTNNGVFATVYDGRTAPSKQQMKPSRGSYTTTAFDLLRYQRNFVVHAVEHLKDTSLNPTISTLDEVDYLLSYLWDKFLVDILQRLIAAFDMKSLFEQVWEDCTSSLAKNCSL